MSELLHSPDAELAALKARVARLERLARNHRYLGNL